MLKEITQMDVIPYLLTVYLYAALHEQTKLETHKPLSSAHLNTINRNCRNGRAPNFTPSTKCIMSKPTPSPHKHKVLLDIRHQSTSSFIDPPGTEDRTSDRFVPLDVLGKHNASVTTRQRQQVRDFHIKGPRAPELV